MVTLCCPDNSSVSFNSNESQMRYLYGFNVEIVLSFQVLSGNTFKARHRWWWSRIRMKPFPIKGRPTEK